MALSGSIQGEDGTFNISQADNITAGHINTSTDTYSFEVFGDTGWIHQSGALFTGELPPVVDDSSAVVNSTLGNQGEQIFAKGNNEIEGAVHNHSHGQPSNNNEASPDTGPIDRISLFDAKYSKILPDRSKIQI